MSKLRGVTTPHILQQQGNKNSQSGRPQNLPNTSLTKGITTSSDEFKYGFPSDGLSAVSYNWWGSGSPDGNGGFFFGDGAEVNEDDKHQSEELADEGAKPETGKGESNIGPQGTGLLMTVRKRAVEEGREALKIGVVRGYGINKRGMRERTLLLRIFKSSLPSQWLYGSS
ncbi:hypothetical protein L1049_024248 [Liquidambar formosana]|uniref:Uncharacterized protein n=1 Tax=Liquidambar formosana TaxID=63359 RepID=A0AAP0RU50_LIQFO